MSGSSSVPNIQFTDNGLVLPQESDILDGCFTDINAAFGNQLTTNLETPQGQLASSWTTIIADKNDTFAQFVALVDPATSSGIMQDAIAKLYFLERLPPLPTIVNVNCIGVSGTVIPANSQITDIDGNFYYAVDGGVIGSGGNVTLEFANFVNGAIPCSINSVKIYQSVAGLDRVENLAAGTLGRDAETPQAFEYRRKLSVFQNANGSVGAIFSNVLAVANVSDAIVINNPRSTSLSYGSTNYVLAPNSVYVGVVGGDDGLIGRAILQKLNLGCGMNGNTTVSVPDTSYSSPQPTYDIIFNRPTDTRLRIAVQIQNSALLPTGITQSVKDAVLAAFNGTNGQRARIGGAVLASNFYFAISSVGANVFILSVLVAKGTQSPIFNSISFGIDENPTLDESDILVSLV
jgi:hypothetical protein